jgi:hypothetical protein
MQVLRSEQQGNDLPKAKVVEAHLFFVLFPKLRLIEAEQSELSQESIARLPTE